MAVVKRWWVLIDEASGSFEIPVDKIADFMVLKNIAIN